VNDFLNQIAGYLETQSVGIFEDDDTRDIFVDSTPADPTNLIALMDATGPAIGDGREIADLHFPRFQAYVRDVSHDAGTAKLAALRAALHAKYGIILTNWRVLRCHADQEGGWIGKDGQGRHEFSINFTAEVNAETA
jgi:hypothetical protein